MMSYEMQTQVRLAELREIGATERRARRVVEVRRAERQERRARRRLAVARLRTV